LSDGVFAMSSRLLVLEIKVPHVLAHDSNRVASAMHFSRWRRNS